MLDVEFSVFFSLKKKMPTAAGHYASSSVIFIAQKSS